ncbi:MAG: MlaA family lipoprotein [Rhodoferax sp.]
MSRWSRCVRWIGAVGMALAFSGCATVAQPDARDPWEPWNRGMFGFNEAVDKAVVKPVAQGYEAVTPSWFRKGVGNFFSNLGDVWSAVNNALQGRGKDTGDSIGRVMVNSTIGVLGLVDVASDLGIERHSANFGLTLGRWGMGPGPYVVLPVLGPSTLRDTAGLPVDLYGSPLAAVVPDPPSRNGFIVLNAVDTRAKLLGAGDVLDGAALDKYSFVRDAYLQRRRNQVYDGNPPEEESEGAVESKQ